MARRGARSAATAAVAQGVDALTDQVWRTARGHPGSAVLRWELSRSPEHLAPDEMLVAFIERARVTVRVLGRRGHGKHRPSPDLLSEAIVEELEVLDDATMEFLAAAPNAPSGVQQLTVAEDELLAATDPENVPGEGPNPSELTAIAYGRLVATSLDTGAAAERLGVDPSRIRQRAGGRAPTIYAFKYRDDWRVPAFEFDGDQLIPGVEVVVPRLARNIHPVAVARWFTSSHVDLVADEEGDVHLSPRDWLRQGRSPEVIAELASEL